MVTLIIVVLILVAITVATYIYWRFFFFYRDPIRQIPPGNNIVAPADGTVVYAKIVDNNTLPISYKKGKKIELQDLLKTDIKLDYPYYLVGIFMHPTSVHVNRSPIDGIVKGVTYSRSKNLPMTIMWWRSLLRIKPFEKYSKHIIQNERNVLSIIGKISVIVVQIADIYVNKIECWVKEGDNILKGNRFGMIKMGSQVDLLFTANNVSKLKIVVGQKVVAGETIIAEINK